MDYVRKTRSRLQRFWDRLRYDAHSASPEQAERERETLHAKTKIAVAKYWLKNRVA